MVGPMRLMWTRQEHYHRLKRAAVAAAQMTDVDGLADAVSHTMIPEHHMVDELEREYGHDVAAYVEWVRRQLPPDLRDAFHRGRTSSDLVDTALGLALFRATDIINEALDVAVTHTARYAWTWRGTPMLGRTHGRLAERTTLGRRWAVLAHALWNAGIVPYQFGHLSGPVGADTNGEDETLEALGLIAVPSGQCVPRVYLHNWATQLSVVATTAEAIATEIRLGCQEGIDFYAEGRVGGYRGSSSMPIKHNPTRSERICGLARTVRSHVSAVGESCALWNERDISHSSVERTALIPAVILTHYILVELGEIMSSLVTYDGNVVRGTERMTSAEALAAMTGAGVPHALAYREIQQHGPEVATAFRKIAVERDHYEPENEPKLWEWVEGFYRTTIPVS